MREVARASASCSALLRVWTTHPYLRFDEETLRLQPNPDDDPFLHASSFVRLVDAILLSPRRRRHHPPLEELTVRFAYLRPRHAPRVDAWVRFAVASTTTKRLTLDLLPHGHGLRDSHRLYYAFPCSLLAARPPSLEHLFLRQGSLAATPPRMTGTANLATLVLAYVRVTGEDLERFLSSCHKLRSLELRRCDLLEYVNVGGAAGKRRRLLTSLAVENCWSLTSLDVSGSAVESLRLAGQNLPPSLLLGSSSPSPAASPRPALTVTSATFDLEYLFAPVVPKTSKKKKKRLKPPQLELLRVAQVLPCLETLDLRLDGDITVVAVAASSSPAAAAGRFHHLRRVDLSLVTLDDNKYDDLRRCWQDLLFIYSLLGAAPALEALSLRLMRFAPTYYEVYDKTTTQRPAAARPAHLLLAAGAHRSLRFVDITGFDADVASLDLVLYILEKASALQSVSLEPTYAGDEARARAMARHIGLIRQAIARHIAPEVPSGILLQVK